MRVPRRLLTLLTAALMLCALGGTAFAREVPDLDRTGSISITIKTGNTAVAGGTLTLYRVGEIQERDGNDCFSPVEAFSGFDQPLEEVQSPELAKELAEYARAHRLTGVTKEIGQDGKIAFSDLELGLYLLVQEKAADGYSKITPFLVSVPLWEDGAYVYGVDASPKVEVKKEPEPPESPKPPKPDTPGRLPQTGQLNWPVPVLVLAGLTLFSLGWGLRFGTGKKRNEK